MSRTIYLGSFWAELPEGTARFSVARWNPRELKLPVLRNLAPVTQSGRPIDKRLGAAEYLKQYALALVSRQQKIIQDLSHITGDSVGLLCWERMYSNRPPGLMCHTILLGWLLQEKPWLVGGEVEVVFLEGRQYPVWTGEDRQTFLQSVGSIWVAPAKEEVLE